MSIVTYSPNVVINPSGASSVDNAWEAIGVVACPEQVNSNARSFSFVEGSSMEQLLDRSIFGKNVTKVHMSCSVKLQGAVFLEPVFLFMKLTLNRSVEEKVERTCLYVPCTYVGDAISYTGAVSAEFEVTPEEVTSARLRLYTTQKLLTVFATSISVKTVAATAEEITDEISKMTPITLAQFTDEILTYGLESTKPELQ